MNERTMPGELDHTIMVVRYRLTSNKARKPVTPTRRNRPMARRDREHASPWEPLRSSVAYWNTFSRTASIWWTRREGMAAIEVSRQARLIALVEYARQHSPFYREAYAHFPGPGLAATALSVQDLPVVTKQALMARFDDWVTDPAVTRVDVDAFLADKRAVGKRYLDRYVLWQSSGSTGEPG